MNSNLWYFITLQITEPKNLPIFFVVMGAHHQFAEATTLKYNFRHQNRFKWQKMDDIEKTIYAIILNTVMYILISDEDINEIASDYLGLLWLVWPCVRQSRPFQ